MSRTKIEIEIRAEAPKNIFALLDKIKAKKISEKLVPCIKQGIVLLSMPEEIHSGFLKQHIHKGGIADETRTIHFARGY